MAGGGLVNAAVGLPVVAVASRSASASAAAWRTSSDDRSSLRIRTIRVGVLVCAQQSQGPDQRLPPPRRRVVVLFVLEGAAVAEVGLGLGLGRASLAIGSTARRSPSQASVLAALIRTQPSSCSKQGQQPRQVFLLGAQRGSQVDMQIACVGRKRSRSPAARTTGGVGRLRHAARLAQQLEGMLARLLPQAGRFDQVARQQVAASGS